jgi:hypothetical protein
MANILSTKPRAKRKFLGFCALLFVLVILCSHAGIQNQITDNSKKSLCPDKNKNAKTLNDANEMLFSLRSFILFDSGDAINP